MQSANAVSINVQPLTKNDLAQGLTLGLTLVGHDISYVVLGTDGSPIIIAEDERYSRWKRGTFAIVPIRLKQILQEVNVNPNNIKHIAIANIPELSESRYPEENNKGAAIRIERFSSALYRSIVCMFGEVESVVYVRHHLCHAASAFLPSPFEHAAIVTADGVGENETATIWLGNGTLLKQHFSIRYPHSIGSLYDAVASWAGLTGYEKAGKLMGLAAYGKPKFLDIIETHFLNMLPNGGFAINPILGARPQNGYEWAKYCEEYFGKILSPNEPPTQVQMDVAASIQLAVERALTEFLQLAKRLTGETQCCLAGGVFMNSMANGRLRREKIFDDIWVQPMAQDNGLSLGAALWSYSRRNPRSKSWQMVNPFLGSNISNSEILTLIDKLHLKAYRSPNIEHDVARRLADGKLVGWVQGRSEVGARALGHRSIFADPRNPTSKARLNDKIKRREDWRPFAPAVLEEDTGLFFTETQPSPFMTFVSRVLNGSEIPAVVHIDETARVQTINEEFDSRVYKLLQEFKALTGLGVLLNTSFNRRGEPIVRTAEEAYQVFVQSGMDVLILEDYIFEKKNNEIWVGPPLQPEPFHITVTEGLSHFLSESDSVAIIGLGSSFPGGLSYFVRKVIEVIRNECQAGIGTKTFFISRSGSKSDLLSLEIIDESKTEFSIGELSQQGFSHIILLLPTWIDIALETVPSFLSPFFKLIEADEKIQVFLLDEQGGGGYLNDALKDWNLVGTPAESYIEHISKSRNSYRVK